MALPRLQQRDAELAAAAADIEHRPEILRHRQHRAVHRIAPQLGGDIGVAEAPEPAVARFGAGEDGVQVHSATSPLPSSTAIPPAPASLNR